MFQIIILFFYPFFSHTLRQGFECTKNINDAIYDTSFMITYSLSVLFYGFISDYYKITKYLLIYSLFCCVILSLLLYYFDYTIILWNINAHFHSILWPICYKLIFKKKYNPFIKSIWSLNGPIGDLIGCYFFKRQYYNSIALLICLILTYFIDNDNDNKINKQLLIPITDSVIQLEQNSNKLIKILFYFIILLTINLKIMTYSISNWLPLIGNYNYYNYGTIIGTILTGVLLNITTKIEFICLINSIILFFIFYFKLNYILIGIFISICNTNVSLFMCEKCNKHTYGLSTMTAILDFSGTIITAFLQLIAYTNYNLLLFYSSISLMCLFFIIVIIDYNLSL